MTNYPLPTFDPREPGFVFLASWASAVDFDCAREDNPARDMSLVDYAAPMPLAVSAACTVDWLSACQERAIADTLAYMVDEEEEADLFPSPLAWTSDGWQEDTGPSLNTHRLVLAYGDSSGDPELLLVVDRRKLEEA